MTDTCIYCDKKNVFTDEHVVSAGLGGDDPAWMLKDCVCGNCNTKVFSPLELKAFRSSPIALARLFLQPKTRGRGGQTGTPSIQASVSYYEDIATALLLEQELGPGGRPVLLPQMVIVSSKEMQVFVSDAAKGAKFIEQVKQTLSQSTLSLVEKVREGAVSLFYATSIRWGDEKGFFQDGDRTEVSKPPTDGLWIEPLDFPSRPNVEEEFKLPPRLFQRSGGQLVCRVASTAHAMALASIARTDLTSITIPASAVPKEVKGGQVRQSLNVDLTAWDRVRTKISINLCAKIFGLDLVRRPEFSSAKAYALTGKGHVLTVPSTKAHLIAPMFGPALDHHHVFIITASKAQDVKKTGLAVFSRLYGGPVEGVLPAELPIDVPLPNKPIFVVVDYHAQRIQQMTTEEYAAFAVENAASYLPS
ncbi:MAG: hypothetical protein P4M05_33460 [Bradyrhizobium sp.]|nr:hypothetical protein [Bradyrhizobium sp.]